MMNISAYVTNIDGAHLLWHQILAITFLPNVTYVQYTYIQICEI